MSNLAAEVYRERAKIWLAVVPLAAAMLLSCSATVDEDESLEAASAAQTNPNDPSWDCYAPEPGHPTAAEKASFFATHAAAAQEAERSYGVPAAALLAMAAVEGGYGFTRIALFAKNTFGYKFTSSSAAGGRGSYTLSCQPSWDVGNRYIVFGSVRDGMLFVGYKLATRADWANYKGPTDAYRAARRSGAGIQYAVNAWVDGIADAGYNYDPPTYKRTIKSVIAANELYRYSSAVSPGGGTSAPAGGGGQDVSPSSWISVSSPAVDAYVSGDVPLRVGTSADVTKVVFVSIKGSNEYVVGSSTGPSFGAQWATAGWVPNGSYVLRFDAYAGATKVASTSRRVYVAN
jgi:hypothetical protein